MVSNSGETTFNCNKIRFAKRQGEMTVIKVLKKLSTIDWPACRQTGRPMAG